jgi:hypothetical protein
MIDHSKMKLGRYKSHHDPRTLKLWDYLVPHELPPIPLVRDWTEGLSGFGEMLNNQIGDCTCAGAAHSVQTMSAVANPPMHTIPDANVLEAYQAITGYEPADPSTDTGACLLDVLKYWRKHGIGDHKIAGFVQVSPQNMEHCQAAIELFGGLYSGAGLPITAQSQEVWDVTPEGISGRGAPYSWGGHCIWIPAYAPFKCITWGLVKVISDAFAVAYIDERWAVLTEDFINKATAASPAGLKFQQLQDDLDAIK